MPHFDVDWDVEFMQLQQRLKELGALIFLPRQPVPELYACVTGKSKGPERAPKTGWKPFKVMGRWGGYDQTTWFRIMATVPKSFSGKRVVALIHPCAHTHITGIGPQPEAGEGLAYVNGKPYHGVDRAHGFVVLSEKARAGERFDIALECCPSTRYDATQVMTHADISVMNTDIWDLYWDGKVYLDLVLQLPKTGTLRRRLFSLLFEAMCMVDLQNTEAPSFPDSVTRARRFLRKGLKDFPAEPHAGSLTLIGHSHIDTAWLWPLRETRRKVGRTFATVLRLMELYPEFHFSASQPELYMFVKENYPELWKDIKRRVKEGRWEPCGATWVEQDSNVPCGESLVRQLLYGNRFYEREFGMRSRVAWLPDAFGYPWSLPQILVKAGIEAFHTIKISWSLYTKFPHSYFLWQGVDGTRIRAVMPPLNYNGDPTPEQCIKQWEGFSQKHLVREVPFSYGHGDGGGGPTPEMIEYGRRLANIAGAPRCSFGRTQDCFDRMRAYTDASELPVHNGELYLELHRGCQTTQARTKRNNRKCEWLLHDVEMFSALASLHGMQYDGETINKAWRILLTHQFHDILPGSSITEVYADADRHYATIRKMLMPLLDQAKAHLGGGAAGEDGGAGTPIIVWNTLSWPRDDVASLAIKVPAGPWHIKNAEGQAMPSQKLDDKTILFEVRNVPALGGAQYRLVPGAAETDVAAPLKITAKSLENAYVKVTLDAWGRFRRVYDKRTGRDVLAKGAAGNVLQLFDDRPAANDAWDIDFNFEAKAWEPGKAESIEVLESGPVRGVIRVVRKTRNSVFTQDITLYANSPRIEVNTHVDWHEKRCLLKVAFPVEVLSPRATYHIQFAAIERPTHTNTAFDHARFEVPAQHWADLSEADYGVSLLNDCKYAYDVRDNVLRLSLLRSPVDPDPHADEGEHRFTYALLPHQGDWRGDVVREGYQLNSPLHAWAVAATSKTTLQPPLLDGPDRAGVIIETIKKAEDSNALVIRLYEAHGGRGVTRLRFNHPVKSIAECNLMEEPVTPLELDKNNVLRFEIKPFEIRSFLVQY